MADESFLKEIKIYKAAQKTIKEKFNISGVVTPLKIKDEVQLDLIE